MDTKQQQQKIMTIIAFQVSKCICHNKTRNDETIRRLSLVLCACPLEGATQKCYCQSNSLIQDYFPRGHPKNIHVCASTY